jgi:CBS domain-containing protein
MTTGAITCELDASIQQAAREMRDRKVGSLIACDHGEIKGIITDRDIVTRAIADGASPTDAKVADVCTTEVATIGPSESVERAIEFAHERHVRRLPVVENGQPIGVLSLHDLAVAG